MFDGAEEIARNFAGRVVQFCRADPDRAARQTNSIEPVCPAKQRCIPVAPNLSENARRYMLGSRIVRAVAGEESRGNRVGELEDTHQIGITLLAYARPQSTILLSGYSTIPCAPAAFKRGMMVRTMFSSTIVFTAIHAGSLSVDTVGFFSAGSTPNTAAR